MLPEWEAVKVYLYYRRKLDQSNDDSYHCCFKTIFQYFLDRKFDLTNVDQFFSFQQSRNLSNSTLNNYLKMLKHIDRFMGTNILVDYTYFKKIQPTRSR